MVYIGHVEFHLELYERKLEPSFSHTAVQNSPGDGGSRVSHGFRRTYWIALAQPRCLQAQRGPVRANAEINFRNGGSAEGSLARRGGRPIPRKGWDPFFPPRLGLPTQHSRRPLAAPALSQAAVLKESLGRRPGRNGLSAVSEAQGQGLWTLAFASSWQTGHFASAVWKFLSAFALELGTGTGMGSSWLLSGMDASSCRNLNR